MAGEVKMSIPESFIDELVSRTDITELVGEYVRLTKKSGNNMFGLCPFHSEKTPSFSVNSDLQLYRCWGCGKGGGAITFVREMENLPFRDAVEVLAKRAGMTIPEETGKAEITNRRKRILELNKDAAKHFLQMLLSSHGQTARKYLEKRGLTKATVTKFGIGAAPDNWSLLHDAMIKKGYAKQELIDAGLCRHGQKGTFDFFRNRLMFPVIDVRGDVVAFSGRTLDPNADSHKYLNSTDTIAFSKGRNLFGLNFARKTKSGMLVLVEGNIDVTMLHQAGFDNAVAPLGTAFTENQARLLSNYTKKVVIAFDPDEPGERATLKALPLIEATGTEVKVIDLGTSGDPDDFIKKRGADAFRVLLERGENHIEYRLQTIRGNHDIETDEGRLKYLSAATQYLTEIESRPEREIYSTRVAETAKVSVESVKNEINRIINIKQKRNRKDFEKTVTRPRAGIQPVNREFRYDNAASAVAEEGVIRCLLHDSLLLKAALEKGFSAEEFTSKILAKIYLNIEHRLTSDMKADRAQIMSSLEPDEAALLMSILEKPESQADGEKTILQYIEKIRTERMARAVPDESLLLEIMNSKKKKKKE